MDIIVEKNVGVIANYVIFDLCLGQDRRLFHSTPTQDCIGTKIEKRDIKI